MQKPKIIVFTTSYYPFIGGAEIAVQEIAERLKDRFDFYIITSRFRRDLPKREIRPEGTVIRLGFGTILDKWLLLFLAIWNLGRKQMFLFPTGVAREFAERANFGIWNSPKHRVVLWGVDISQGALAAAVFKLFHPRIPFVFNIQYGYGDDRLAKGRFGLIGLTFRFILSRADFVTAISSYLLDTARNYGYKGPAEVIHNGVAIEKFQNTDSKSQTKHKAQSTKHKTIITTSRLVPKNGVDILIKAMAEVKKKMPDIQCWILGDGPEGESLKSKVKSLKLTENIKFFGEVSYRKIPEYFRQADVFVRPSRSEGMGNSFIEALAAGLPIIGTPVGGLTDIIEDGKTGLFARVDDPKDLAEKIMSLLGDQNLANLIIREGQKMVETRFSLDSVAKRYSHIFDNYYRGRTSIVILIATPLFPPQLGGPALYAKNLSEEFRKFGQHVSTVSFGGFLAWPSGVRHILYFLALLGRALRCDLIFALDYTSVGIPAAAASFLLRKPLVVRVEGDFLWESFVERTRSDITLSRFYREPQPLTLKERSVRSLSGWVVRRASYAVFSSEWRRKMVLRAQSIPDGKTAIIRNVWPDYRGRTSIESKVKGQRSKVILWAGRMLYLKNLYRLIYVWKKIDPVNFELHFVGEGPECESLKLKVKSLKLDDNIKFFPPMAHEELIKKISNSWALVLPSLSEVGPNIIAEAVGLGVRVIMTQESGFAEYLHGKVDLVDPLDENDLRVKLEKLMKEPVGRIMPFFYNRSWSAAAKDWLNLFHTL